MNAAPIHLLLIGTGFNPSNEFIAKLRRCEMFQLNWIRLIRFFFQRKMGEGEDTERKKILILSH